MTEVNQTAVEKLYDIWIDCSMYPGGGGCGEVFQDVFIRFRLLGSALLGDNSERRPTSNPLAKTLVGIE
jgi:hypothetical protein